MVKKDNSSDKKDKKITFEEEVKKLSEEFNKAVSGLSLIL